MMHGRKNIKFLLPFGSISSQDWQCYQIYNKMCRLIKCLFFTLFYVIYLFIQQIRRWAFAIVFTVHELGIYNPNPPQHTRCLFHYERLYFLLHFYNSLMRSLSTP